MFEARVSAGRLFADGVAVFRFLRIRKRGHLPVARTKTKLNENEISRTYNYLALTFKTWASAHGAEKISASAGGENRSVQMDLPSFVFLNGHSSLLSSCLI
jgi:hypothetical protein